eukprot:357578-Chlamydomonas_euryale.AAC.5
MQGGDSFYAPYVQSLPEELPCAWALSDAELDARLAALHWKLGDKGVEPPFPTHAPPPARQSLLCPPPSVLAFCLLAFTLRPKTYNCAACARPTCTPAIESAILQSRMQSCNPECNPAIHSALLQFRMQSRHRECDPAIQSAIQGAIQGAVLQSSVQFRVQPSIQSPSQRFGVQCQILESNPTTQGPTQ